MEFLKPGAPMRKLQIALCLIATSTTLWACRRPGRGPAVSIEIRSGNNETSAIGGVVAVSVRVRYASTFSSPPGVANYPVTFSVQSGGGSISAAVLQTAAQSQTASVTTDPFGIATAYWTLGTGPNTLEATALNTGAHLVFSAGVYQPPSATSGIPTSGIQVIAGYNAPSSPTTCPQTAGGTVTIRLTSTPSQPGSPSSYTDTKRYTLDGTVHGGGYGPICQGTVAFTNLPIGTWEVSEGTGPRCSGPNSLGKNLAVIITTAPAASASCL